MSESTKIEGLVKTAMDKVREMADCETVVGKPIVTADGTTISQFQRYQLALRRVAQTCQQ